MHPDIWVLLFLPICIAYQCDPLSCKAPTCHCASTSIPGTIARNLAPQFVTLSFDDYVQPDCFQSFQKPLLCENSLVCGKRYRATFFVATDWSDYYPITQLYNWGTEMADHTMSHDATNSNKAAWTEQIQGARQYISTMGGLPQSEIVGFRTPFLNPDMDVYNAIKDIGGFAYDSSLVDRINMAGGLSTAQHYVYPFTLDNGTPFCGDTTMDPAVCKMSIPGLWEFPLSPLLDASSNALTLMDLAGTDVSSKLAILKLNFLNHYNGNRAPFHIPLHCSYSASPQNLDVLNQFYDWAHAYTNVFFATYSQILQWMKNPVPGSKVAVQSYMFLKVPKPSIAVCDGFDHNGNGLIDQGLVRTCSYMEKYFQCCSPCCPTHAPLATYWTPSFSLPCSFCQSKSDGYYTDPASVSGFYHCVSHITYHFFCPPGLQYDNSVHNCK